MPDGYVSWASAEHYLGEGQATSYRLSAPSVHPEVSYVVEHGGRDISLHVELDARHLPPKSALPLVRIDQIADRGMRMARLRVARPELVRDFHDLVNAVADRIVRHGHTLDQAFRETVRAWSELLEQPRGLRSEQRIGLIGELTTLATVAHAYGWPTALESWRGPEREEHDFGLPGWDLEVKTTLSERRRHTVHGLGQLTPTGRRPLWLLSLQITRGGADGRTLTDSVNAVRNIVANNAGAQLDLYDKRISEAGWTPSAQDDERWHLRSVPLPLLVDDGVPRLDTSAVPSTMQGRISDITYAVDVTGLEPSPEAPPALHDPSALRLP